MPLGPLLLVHRVSVTLDCGAVDALPTPELTALLREIGPQAFVSLLDENGSYGNPADYFARLAARWAFRAAGATPAAARPDGESGREQCPPPVTPATGAC